MTADTDRIYGHTVHLSLDMNAQYLVERIADKAWAEHLPDSMMILVMDAKTAEILSWVSRPSYDPNTFTESTWNERINRPLAVAYEPGSVFKVFTWSTFIDMGGVLLDDIFDTRGGYEPELFVRYGIPPITDLGNYGILDVPGALGAVVVLHVTGARHVQLTVLVGRSLELRDEFTIGDAHRVGQNVQATSMGHPEDHLARSVLREVLDRDVQHRH